MSETKHEAYVEKFRDFWADPSAERMAEFLTDDVVLIQPLSYPMEGLAAAQEEFGRLFTWIPDLRGETTHCSGDGDTLFIEHTLTGTVGRNTQLQWPMVDQPQGCRRFGVRGIRNALLCISHESGGG